MSVRRNDCELRFREDDYVQGSQLLTELLRRAQLNAAQALVLLLGILGTVSDWRIANSTTMLVRGGLMGQLGIKADLGMLLVNEVLITEDKAIDADVELGPETNPLWCRLIGISTPTGDTV